MVLAGDVPSVLADVRALSLRFNNSGNEGRDTGHRLRDAKTDGNQGGTDSTRVKKCSVDDDSESIFQDVQSRMITQFHYTAWPENDRPRSTSSILNMVDQLQKWQQANGDKVITIHCK